MPKPCQVEMARYVAGLAETTPVRKVTTAWKAFLFSNPAGRIADIVGTGIMMGAESFPRALFATAADRYIAAPGVARRMSARAGGSKVEPYQVRTRTFHARSTFRGLGEGAGEGLEDAWRVIRTGSGAVEMNRALDQVYGEINYETPFLNFAVNGIFRLVKSVDRPYFWMNFRRSLLEQARLRGIQAGLKGPALDDYVKRLLPVMPDEDVVIASHDGLVAVFQDVSTAAQGLSRLKSGLSSGIPGVSKDNPAGELIAEAIFPVTRTPSNAAQRVAEYSPLGLGMGYLNLRRAFKLATNGDPKDVANLQRYAVDQMGRSMAGMGALMAGWWLAERNMVSLGYPTDRGEQGNIEATGRQPNSIRIGGRWLSMERMAPWGPLMVVGAYAQQAAAGGLGDDTGKRLLETGYGMIGGIARISSDQPALTGAEQVAGLAEQGGKGVSSWVENMAASVVPGIVGRVADYMDPVRRERYLDEVAGVPVPEALREPLGGIVARVPMASRTLPERHDALGGEVPRRDGFLANFLDPFYSMRDRSRDDAVRREMDRLGVRVTRITYKQNMGDREAFHYRREVEGTILRALLAEVVASDEYTGIAEARRMWANTVPGMKPKNLQRQIDEDQKKFLEEVIKQARSAMAARRKDGWLADGGPDPLDRDLFVERQTGKALDTAAERQELILAGEPEAEEEP